MCGLRTRTQTRIKENLLTFHIPVSAGSDINYQSVVWIKLHGIGHGQPGPE